MAATSEDDEMKGLNDLEKEMESHEEDDDDEDDDDSSSSSSKSSTRSQGERRTSFSVPGGKGEECEGLMAGQYRMGKLIGRGGFGTVHKALNVNTGQIVAIKRFHAAKITKSKLAAVMAEADVLEKLNHSNVVKFIGYVKTQDFLHLVLEYVEEGALSDVLKDYGRFPENITALYTAQMLKGLAYLHEQRVIHRDIKGANVLLTKDGGIKLTDFGVAAVINESEKRFSVVGTPYWMAPEVIEVAGHSTKSDIWSVGSTVYQLIMGEPPHFDLQPLAAMYRIVKERRPPLPKPCSDELADFLSKCWNKEPSKRPSAKELLSHPWITNAVPPESKPEQVVLPPEELKTSLKTHNSVVIHRASVSSDQHSDREDDNEDDDGRGDTMYISSSYPCIESESEDENGEKIPRMPSSEQEMEEWEREGRRTARSSSTSGVPTTNLSSGNSKRKSGSSVRRMTAAMKSHSSDAEEMNRKREKAERERRERERRREEKMEKKEKKREEKIRLKESRESMRMQQKEKEDKALKKSFSKYTVDSEERPICQNGLACNSDDAEHFLKFRHTPLTTPPTAEKDKTIIFLSSSSDGFERLDKSDSDSARNSSEIKTSTPDKPYAAMWKKLEDALYDNGKLRSRNDELEQEVERVMGQRDDLLIQLAEMRSYTDEVLALANMVLSADHNGKKEKEAKLKKILQTLVDEKPKRTQSHEELLISVASELKANKKKKEKKVKKELQRVSILSRKGQSFKFRSMTSKSSTVGSIEKEIEKEKEKERKEVLKKSSDSDKLAARDRKSVV